MGGGAAVDLGSAAWPILPELPAALAQLCARSVPDTWLAHTTHFPGVVIGRCLPTRVSILPSGWREHVRARMGQNEYDDVSGTRPVQQLVSEQGSRNVDMELHPFGV